MVNTLEVSWERVCQNSLGYRFGCWRSRFIWPSHYASFPCRKKCSSSGAIAFRNFLAEKNSSFMKNNEVIDHYTSATTNRASMCVPDCFAVTSFSAVAALTGPDNLSSCTHDFASLAEGQQTPSLPTLSPLCSSSRSVLLLSGNGKMKKGPFISTQEKEKTGKNSGAVNDLAKSPSSSKRSSENKAAYSSFSYKASTGKSSHWCSDDRGRPLGELSKLKSVPPRFPPILKEAKDMLQQLKHVVVRVESFLHATASKKRPFCEASRPLVERTTIHPSTRMGKEQRAASRTLVSLSNDAKERSTSSLEKDVSHWIDSVHHLLAPWTPERYRRLCACCAAASSKGDFILEFLSSLVKTLLRMDRFFSALPYVFFESCCSSSLSSSLTPTRLPVYFRSKGALKSRVREWRSYSAVYPSLECATRLCVERLIRWRREHTQALKNMEVSCFPKGVREPFASCHLKGITAHACFIRQTKADENHVLSLLHGHDQLLYHTVWKAARVCRHQKALGTLRTSNDLRCVPGMSFPDERPPSSQLHEEEELPFHSSEKEENRSGGVHTPGGSVSFSGSTPMPQDTLQAVSMEEWCVRWWLRPGVLTGQLERRTETKGHASKEAADVPLKEAQSVPFGPPSPLFFGSRKGHEEEHVKACDEFSMISSLPNKDLYSLSLTQAATVLSAMLDGSACVTFACGSTTLCHPAGGLLGDGKRSSVCSPSCGAWLTHAFIDSTHYWYHVWLRQHFQREGVPSHPSSFNPTTSFSSVITSQASTFWIKAVTLSCRAIHAFPAWVHIGVGAKTTEQSNGREYGFQWMEDHGKETGSQDPSGASPPPLLQCLLQLLIYMIPLIVSNVPTLAGGEVIDLLQAFTMLGFSGEWSPSGSLFSGNPAVDNGSRSKAQPHRTGEMSTNTNIYALLANRAGEIAETLTVHEMQRVLEAVEKVQTIQRRRLGPRQGTAEVLQRKGKRRTQRTNVADDSPLDERGAIQQNGGHNEKENVDHTLRCAFESVCRLRSIIERKKSSIAS